MYAKSFRFSKNKIELSATAGAGIVLEPGTPAVSCLIANNFISVNHGKGIYRYGAGRSRITCSFEMNINILKVDLKMTHRITRHFV